jgi:5-methylcytosine-specific restriction endonuclease McrA
MKTCTLCKNNKLLNDFYGDKRSKDGKQYRCIDCYKIAQAKYRSENRELLRIKNKKYKEIYGKEKLNEAQKKRRNSNLSVHRKKEREYARKHKDEKKLYHSWWRKENRESLNNYNKEQRVLRKISKELKIETLNYLKLIKNDLCSYCLEPSTEVDHIIPICKGGQTDYTNLAPICRHCNASKNGRDMLAFIMESK